VNAVAPGITRTPMSEGGFLAGRMGEEFLAHTPMGRFGEPEDVALQNYWATMNEETPA
jgi:3-oxoacyl-[acyl-carrier protein] reductase